MTVNRRENDRQKREINLPLQKGRKFIPFSPMKKWSGSSKEDWVVMSNQLAEQRTREAMYSLTALDRKIFAYLVGTLGNPGDDQFRMQRIVVSDFGEKMGMSHEGGKLYREIGSCIRRMMTTIVEFPCPEKQGAWVMCTLLARGKYHKGEGWYEAQIHEDLRPALLKLNQRFFQYKLEEIGRLGSAYAVRLYELSKSRENQAEGWFEYDLLELRKILDVAEGKLRRWHDFRRFAIDYSVEQINRETDISVEYLPRKRGRRVHSVLFHVLKNKPKKNEPKRVRLPSECPRTWSEMTAEEQDDYRRWAVEVVARPDLLEYGNEDKRDDTLSHWWRDRHQQTLPLS